jgi:hypothetical protein
MMTLNAQGNFDPWVQPAYGHDASDNPVNPPRGYRVVPWNTRLQIGDRPFDVYSGWLSAGFADHAAKNGSYTASRGRWTVYARQQDSEREKPRE